MDKIKQHPGSFLATGFSGHRFGIGPGAGSSMAHRMMNNPANHGLSRFRMSLFSDGSSMVTGPGL